MLAKLCQETSETWVTLLPSVLPRVRIALKDTLRLNPFEMVYGKPFLTSDLYFNEEVQQKLSH